MYGEEHHATINEEIDFGTSNNNVNINSNTNTNTNVVYSSLINVQVNLLLDFDGNKIQTYDIELQDTSSLNELITQVIEMFNNDEYTITLNKNEYKVQLNNDSNLYYIKPSKKNKFPKDDYPPFVNELPIKDCIYNNKNIFSLIIKDNTKSINLIKNKKTCGEGCLLF